MLNSCMFGQSIDPIKHVKGMLIKFNLVTNIIVLSHHAPQHFEGSRTMLSIRKIHVRTPLVRIESPRMRKVHKLNLSCKRMVCKLLVFWLGVLTLYKGRERCGIRYCAFDPRICVFYLHGRPKIRSEMIKRYLSQTTYI